MYSIFAVDINAKMLHFSAQPTGNLDFDVSKIYKIEFLMSTCIASIRESIQYRQYNQVLKETLQMHTAKLL